MSGVIAQAVSRGPDPLQFLHQQSLWCLFAAAAAEAAEQEGQMAQARSSEAP